MWHLPVPTTLNEARLERSAKLHSMALSSRCKILVLAKPFSNGVKLCIDLGQVSFNALALGLRERFRIKNCMMVRDDFAMSSDEIISRALFHGCLP